MPVAADNVSMVRAPFETWPNSSRFRAEKRAFEAIKPYASLEISRTSVSGIVIAALHPAITSMAGPSKVSRLADHDSMLQFLNSCRRAPTRGRSSEIVYLGDSSLQC